MAGDQPTLDEQAAEIHRKAEVAQAKAGKAQTLLDNPLLKEALDSHEASIFRIWAASRPEDTETREALYHQYHAGIVFRAYLQRTVENGKLEAMTAAKVPLHGSRSAR